MFLTGSQELLTVFRALVSDQPLL